MRRLPLLVLLGVVAWLVLRRREATPPGERIVVGFADGSQASLDPDGDAGRRLVALASEALGA